MEPLTFAGADLHPGGLVITILGAANHDPALYPDPDTLDTTRYLTTDPATRPAPHLAFASASTTASAPTSPASNSPPPSPNFWPATPAPNPPHPPPVGPASPCAATSTSPSTCHNRQRRTPGAATTTGCRD
ncbi:hypothetical protein [Actinomadura sp. CNU-125]|uniref:hypothetical protein n=1 Tax=Actinomadura sp. CNU-125 TaxID=1904961 RepID=UPI0039678B20